MERSNSKSAEVRSPRSMKQILFALQKYLPKTCTISIYNINGTLIRRFKKDTETTFIEWDLTNSANIVISSGVYLIHVNAPGIGEKVLKWFGSLRPTDLNNF